MIKFICAQAANDYYLWQVEVLINNFIKFGVNPNHIHILLSINNNKVPKRWRILQNHYKEVRFFYYNDTREDLGYIPSIYFNLMKHHLTNQPKLQHSPLFLVDSDIVLTQPIPKNWEEMYEGDDWYLSDTNSYINYDYIQQKGDDIYKYMCKIIGIHPNIPKERNLHSGGAQYIIKNTTPQFWDKVEKDSIKLYNWFCEVEHLYEKKHEGDYPIQKWTSGMWSLLWNAWKHGHNTIVDKRLNFTWSTNSIKQLEKNVILHNAGVTKESKDLFFKGNYISKLPYGLNLDIDKNRGSWFYYQQIKEVETISPIK